MRRVFTLALSLLTGSLFANAQIDNTFSFIDAEGNVIEDGTTIKRTNIENDTFYGPVIHSGLSVKKNVEGSVYARVDYTIKEMTEGTAYQICFVNCKSPNLEAGSYTSAVSLMMGDTEPFMDEWILDANYNPFGDNPVANVKPGSLMTITYTVKKLADANDTSDGIAGPSITVEFTNEDVTSISGTVSEDNGSIVAYYSLDGRKLTAPKKGVNIIKYANGKTAKKVIR